MLYYTPYYQWEPLAPFCVSFGTLWSHFLSMGLFLCRYTQTMKATPSCVAPSNLPATSSTSYTGNPLCSSCLLVWPLSWSSQWVRSEWLVKTYQRESSITCVWGECRGRQAGMLQNSRVGRREAWNVCDFLLALSRTLKFFSRMSDRVI